MTRSGVAALTGLLAAVALAVPPVAAQERDIDDWCDHWGDRDRERVCEVREDRVAATGATIEVDGGLNGGISVEGWDQGEILVRSKIWANARDEARAQSIMDEVRIRTSGGRISADGPDTRRRESWGVSFEVFVPHDSDLALETHNGGIAIEDVGGDIEFEALNGGVALYGVSGDVRGRTTNGGLHVSLTGDSWTGAGLDVETTNGGVKIDVPDDYSAELETGTVNGGIDLAFPVRVEGRIGRRLRTTLGQGGRRVRAVTTNGGVQIRRQRGD